ncbi:MAG: IS200/IS605 family transposase [Chloroflexi bacterium]|nr:IS200/IS605 family transposase [Chloroflexota bacterium]
MAYWRLFYHIVWSTKNRHPLIQAEFEGSLHNVIAAKAKQLGAMVHAVGGIEDHVHLAASVPPKISLSVFISQVKGNSSHFVNQSLGIPFAWQSEYGVVSFGGKNLDLVVKYVKSQHQHHAEQTLLAFLEHTYVKGESAR